MLAWGLLIVSGMQTNQATLQAAPKVGAARAALATGAQHNNPANVGLGLMHVGLYAAYKAGLLRWGSLPQCLQVAAIKHTAAPTWHVSAANAAWCTAAIAATGGANVY